MPAVEFHMEAPESSGITIPTPNKPSNPFYTAVEHDKAGRHKEAVVMYNDLLNADFNNSVLQAALGMSYATKELNGLAFTLLSAALANIDNIEEDFKRLGIVPKVDNGDKSFVKIKRSEILNALGTCYKHENLTDKARECFEAAQADVPINADIQNNLGTLYINEGRPDTAMEHLSTALKIDPDHAQAHWNYALALLESGDYENGWQEYDWGFKANVRQERNYAKQPIKTWDGTPGQTVVVYGEQGIGDEIMFSSCLPELLKVSKKVVFECHKKLHTLFANTFPGIDIYPTREDPVITWPIGPDDKPRYEIDARISIGSLPKFFRPNLESFPGTPFIQPTPEAELYWNQKLAELGPKPKIGISWIGGHKRTRIEVRSMFLEKLLPILRQDATFISLQYTNAEWEIAELENKHGIKVHNFPEAIYSHNYNDTAGLVSNLDLVITVCTSVVHLAGSMGVPTWVLVPSRPAWRYRLDLDYMPWYGKTVTLFRQDHASTDWEPVVEEVSNTLTDLLKGN